jgi:hypothetical protein
MTLIEKCIAAWPEIEWDDISYESEPGTWMQGSCGCGTTVNVKTSSVCVNWHGGLSFHDTLVDAKVAYQKHARKVMESAGFVDGYTVGQVDVVIDATEGRQ